MTLENRLLALEKEVERLRSFVTHAELPQTPARPLPGWLAVYAKDDGNLYTLNSDGEEKQVQVV